MEANSQPLDPQMQDWTSRGVFTFEGAELHYFLVFIGCIVLMETAYFIVSQTVDPLILAFDPEYKNFPKNDKREYYVRIISSIHGFIAAPIAFYQYWNACEDPT